MIERPSNSSRTIEQRKLSTIKLKRRYLRLTCTKTFSEIIFRSLLLEGIFISILLKDGAYYCYCAYVLRISRYSGFLWVVPTNTGIFLRALKLCGESRAKQVLLVSKKKTGGNHAFFRENKASIWKKMPYIALYFTTF